jgi:hypothetical protein
MTYYAGAWHNGPGTTAFTTQTLTLSGGATVQPWFNTGPLTFPVGTTYIDVWESYKTTITAGPSGTVGRISYGPDFGYGGKKMLSDNEYRYGAYAGRWSEMFNVAHSAAKADVAGAIPANSKEPYFGSDYKVSTADLTILASNWGKTVSWTGLINPTDALHRADFVGAGKVSTSDLTALAQGWGSRGSWTDTPPADPASPYIP